MEVTMVAINTITKTMEKHLEAIDDTLDKMIAANYNHESIHAFRESIREFRALMFFYSQSIRPSDYRMVESLSKKFFNMTSLIREIDVFESGYRDFMTDETVVSLAAIKKPLLDKLKEDISEANGFKFNQVKIHLKPLKTREDQEHCISARHCEVLKMFIMVDEGPFNEEKVIHTKRMLAKKILYVHDILMPERQELTQMNEELHHFQVVAKQLHDVCVNLRFVGQYRLDDPTLISKLISDHDQFSRAAESQFEKVSAVIKAYLQI